MDREELVGCANWAQDLTPRQLERVVAEIAERRVPGGGYVCSKGETSAAWIGVVDGLVKMSSLSPQGKAVSFTGVPPGGWFGEGTALKNEPRRYDVVALRNSRIAFVPRETFMWLLDSNLAFNRFVITQLNERLGQFIALVEFDRLLEPDARVARGIAAMFNPHLYPGIGRELQISQEEIGLLCGTSRQRTNQALRVLEARNLLRVGYAGVTILDLEGLRSFEP